MLYNKILNRLIASAVLTLGAGAIPAAAQVAGLEILAPSNPGSGWDQTARAFQGVANEIGAATGIQVVNVGGGGGTIGLSQFVSSSEGKENAIMLTGLAMVSGVLINQSPVSLDEVRPLARLIGEYEVIVVPESSNIQTFEELVEMFKADPMSVSWGAGSAGSADHLFMGVLAKELGVPATSINYIGHSGGGEAVAAIMGGHVTAGVSGYGEFAGQIASGDLRALAISAEKPVEGINIKTLHEQGVAVDFVNWRGIMAPADISEDGFANLAAMVDQVAQSEQWRKLLEERDWMSLYMPPAEFATFVSENVMETEETLKDIGLVQ